jgi:CDP-paratose 2-epimerase
MKRKSRQGDKERTRRERAAPCPPPQNSQQKAEIGFLEWFRPGEHERVEQVLADLQALGVSHLRTGISWADWHTAEGRGWYGWLLPRLARRMTLLPCLACAPPAWAIARETSAPPRDLRPYIGEFLDMIISRFGEHFEWVELWSRPDDHSRDHQGDCRREPWLKFAEMIGHAARGARQRGKKTVLGGMSPSDPGGLRLLCRRGVIRSFDAVGIHGFPASFQAQGQGWQAAAGRVREVLGANHLSPQIWITGTGYPTWRHDERRQLTALVDAIDAPVDRVYWYALQDLDPRASTVGGFHCDERDYHFGLRRSDGGAKLLFRLWSEGGVSAVRESCWIGKPVHTELSQRPVLITGGCGFVGTNLASRLLSEGRTVLLFDNLSRAGVERNLKWLREMHGERASIEAADVRDAYALRRAVDRAAQVFHFAAQVAVTTSLTNAIHDFEVNARGTLNLLEAIRAQDTPPPLLFTSTNKVYGGLPDVKLQLNGSRYEPVDPEIRHFGVSEQRPLDFHSPYGCSKGTADQYVIDYARTFGLPTVVFRMSCIYGPHQFGNEDQGWVAHFLIRALHGKPITIYGDGMQVRDVLFVEDLVDAFLLAQKHIGAISGQGFNIGGGAQNTLSLVELLDLIESLEGRRPDIRRGAWRPGDQRYYVSDIRNFSLATGWQPRVNVSDGVERLHRWLRDVSAPRPLRERGAYPGMAGRDAPSGKRHTASEYRSCVTSGKERP